ncbi:MAG: pyruvate, water dikinase regulatory protein [Lysobacteraceae bacterium]|uniref:posphoenolpyruvate synthetase regulatory kinase/phosphorylase PpsR n=1 Tax=Denitratimonas sp. CY0512 TaxID=3131940 RepID=UPI0016B7D930|nr:kinase/pyrophosphorylase [Gammaproteobacteria bacterium]
MAALRPVFYISDGTGITAETIGSSLLTQFPDVEFATQRIPFVDSESKARSASQRIREAGERSGVRPIVVNTVVDGTLTAVLAESGALMMDVFAPFIVPLEAELGTTRQAKVGHAHGIVNFAKYETRINATNYALTHDDGIDVHYDDADVILVGVSRSGKTPTCLYLALHFGVSAANYPLTEEDLEGGGMPPRLRAHRKKLFGLTIDPMRLQQIRQQRRPDSHYAKLETCKREVQAAEALFRQEGLPSLSTTNTSIEEIASKVMSQLNIDKHLY